MAKNNKKYEPVTMLDTTRIPEHSEVVECCRVNDWEIPEENTPDWWDKANIIKEDELECFKMDLGVHPGKCLAVGSAGLWYGRRDGGTFLEVNKPEDLFYLVSNCDDVKVTVDPDDGITVRGYHHDGTNIYVVRQLTEAGERFRALHEDELSARELHERIFNNPRLSKKITFGFFDKE